MIAIEGGLMDTSRRSLLTKSALTFVALSSGGMFARAQEAGAKTGPLNLITDVVGVRVGNAHDSRLRSGVTVILFDQPAVAAVDVRGGGPGSRETDLLAPENTVQAIDALVCPAGPLSGSTLPAASRPGCASKVVDLPSGLRACRSCRRRRCSISSTAAISSGVLRRRTATSDWRPSMLRGATLPSVARALASGPRLPTC